MKIARPGFTKLGARSSRRMTKSSGFDVQGVYWDGDIWEDLRASDAYIFRELGRHCVSDGRVVQNDRFR
jgi:hypothetical protein